MNDAQKKRLAILRIKKTCPDEFKCAGLRYCVHSAINHPTTRESTSIHNGYAYFSNWNSCNYKLKIGKLKIILDSLHDPVDPKRGAIRVKMARKLAKIMNYQHPNV